MDKDESMMIHGGQIHAMRSQSRIPWLTFGRKLAQSAFVLAEIAPIGDPVLAIHSGITIIIYYKLNNLQLVC